MLLPMHRLKAMLNGLKVTLTAIVKAESIEEAEELTKIGEKQAVDIQVFRSQMLN